MPHIAPVFIAFSPCRVSFFFFFNDTATTEIYTLSLHDALPISGTRSATPCLSSRLKNAPTSSQQQEDRKSTRLNSSHANISYAVFCLKKKKVAPSESKSSRASGRV